MPFFKVKVHKTRSDSGNGRPLTKAPPSWLTPEWPRSGWNGSNEKSKKKRFTIGLRGLKTTTFCHLYVNNLVNLVNGRPDAICFTFFSSLVFRKKWDFRVAKIIPFWLSGSSIRCSIFFFASLAASCSSRTCPKLFVKRKMPYFSFCALGIR